MFNIVIRLLQIKTTMEGITTYLLECLKFKNWQYQILARIQKNRNSFIASESDSFLQR